MSDSDLQILIDFESKLDDLLNKNLLEELFIREDLQSMEFCMAPAKTENEARILKKFKKLVEKCGGCLKFNMSAGGLHIIKLFHSRHLALNSGDDFFLSKYLVDCVTENKLLDLNKYRASRSKYNGNINVMDILTGVKSWEEAVRKDYSSGEEVSDFSDTEDTPKPFRYLLPKSVARKKNYCLSEEKVILNYIIKNHYYYKVKGNTIWQRMEREKICGSRTWQSMKGRYLNYIMQNISQFRLDPVTEAKVLKQFGTIGSDQSLESLEAARQSKNSVTEKIVSTKENEENESENRAVSSKEKCLEESNSDKYVNALEREDINGCIEESGCNILHTTINPKDNEISVWSASDVSPKKQKRSNEEPKCKEKSRTESLNKETKVSTKAKKNEDIVDNVASVAVENVETVLSDVGNAPSRDVNEDKSPKSCVHSIGDTRPLDNANEASLNRTMNDSPHSESSNIDLNGKGRIGENEENQLDIIPETEMDESNSENSPRKQRGIKYQNIQNRATVEKSSNMELNFNENMSDESDSRETVIFNSQEESNFSSLKNTLVGSHSERVSSDIEIPFRIKDRQKKLLLKKRSVHKLGLESDDDDDDDDDEDDERPQIQRKRKKGRIREKEKEQSEEEEISNPARTNGNKTQNSLTDSESSPTERLGKQGSQKKKSHGDEWSEEITDNENEVVSRASLKTKNYSEDDDLLILKYIYKHNFFKRVGGRAIWEDLEERGVLPGRSWHSLKERFRKRIFPRITSYETLSEKIVQTFLHRIPEQRCPTNWKTSKSWKSRGKFEFSTDDDEDAPRRKKGPRNVKYTDYEDSCIIKFITCNKRYSEIKGKSMWVSMSRSQGLRRRTWESLKNRFLQNIVPKLYIFELTENQRENFEVALKSTSRTTTTFNKPPPHRRVNEVHFTHKVMDEDECQNNASNRSKPAKVQDLSDDDRCLNVNGKVKVPTEEVVPLAKEGAVKETSFIEDENDENDENDAESKNNEELPSKGVKQSPVNPFKLKRKLFNQFDCGDPLFEKTPLENAHSNCGRRRRPPQNKSNQVGNKIEDDSHQRKRKSPRTPTKSTTEKESVLAHSSSKRIRKAELNSVDELISPSRKRNVPSETNVPSPETVINIRSSSKRITRSATVLSTKRKRRKIKRSLVF